eukprot:gene12012-biopygen3399
MHHTRGPPAAVTRTRTHTPPTGAWCGNIFSPVAPTHAAQRQGAPPLPALPSQAVHGGTDAGTRSFGRELLQELHFVHCSWTVSIDLMTQLGSLASDALKFANLEAGVC